MTNSTFPVTVKLFAAYREAIGAEQQIVMVEPGTTARNLCDRLIAVHPSLALWQSQTRFGINLDFVEPDTELHPDDEVVLIPPVSGG